MEWIAYLLLIIMAIAFIAPTAFWIYTIVSEKVAGSITKKWQILGAMLGVSALIFIACIIGLVALILTGNLTMPQPAI